MDRWKSHTGSFLSAHHRDDRAGSRLQPPWRVEGAPGAPGPPLTQTSIDPIGEHHGQQANTLPAATHVTSLLKKSRSDTYMASSPTAPWSPAQRREGQAWHAGGFQPAWGWHGEERAGGRDEEWRATAAHPGSGPWAQCGHPGQLPADSGQLGTLKEFLSYYTSACDAKKSSDGKKSTRRRGRKGKTTLCCKT